MLRPAVFCLSCALLCGMLTSGCATSSTPCFKPVGDRGLTPAVEAVRPRNEGAVVTWGGVLMHTRNLADHTELEIMSYPLDDCGKPLRHGPPQGRFLARQPGYLEAREYRTGRPITVTGRIAGMSDSQIGRAAISFPVLDETTIRLWPGAASSATQSSNATVEFPIRPYINIGIGNGRGRVGGGIGVSF